ncbi:hypothetical protein V9K67_20875 [Paraflavisolibacter sp. H34]|uniref:hypothetical protein n=1 Tax=Huijunlia imazamoxiresistens TaxID=3127457 RepID=UPI00301AD68E
MKKNVLLLAICFASKIGFGQVDTSKTVSEQIKDERDKQLQQLTLELQKYELKISKLTERLSSINDKKIEEKIKTLEDLQVALDNKIKVIEEAPKTRISHNGQLAFTELLSMQRDIKPADLFLASRTFFTQLGDITNLQKYDEFNNWKIEYEKWYSKQNSNDQMLDLVNSSVKLVSDATSKVPLYGSIVQTVSSGISALVGSFKKNYKVLAERTPQMLKLLNAASQFEYEKSVIDHEWELINKELCQLQIEDSLLLAEQLTYYGISQNAYKSKYLEENLDNRRESFKNSCRIIIANKFAVSDTLKETKGKWKGQVEVYMYKVQSLRLRFGQLTLRMLSNIDRYKSLISVYSNNDKFPKEFRVKLTGLESTLTRVKETFNSSFQPEKYIADSAVMYIEQQETPALTASVQ